MYVCVFTGPLQSQWLAKHPRWPAAHFWPGLLTFSHSDSEWDSPQCPYAGKGWGCEWFSVLKSSIQDFYRVDHCQTSHGPNFHYQGYIIYIRYVYYIYSKVLGAEQNCYYAVVYLVKGVLLIGGGDSWWPYRNLGIFQWFIENVVYF